MKQSRIQDFVGYPTKSAKFTKPFILKTNVRINKSNPSNNTRSDNLRSDKNN